MEIIQTSEKHVIKKILIKCSDSFFNQSIVDEKRISRLVEKYANNALFRYGIIDKELCGFIAVYANDQLTRQAFLSMIIVKRNFQRQGIGTVLLEDCIKICKLNKMTSLKLEVDKKNKSAIEFYKQKKFRFMYQRDDSIFLELQLEEGEV